MGLGPAEGFVVDVFANGGLHEVAPRQENGACALHDDAFVAHDGEVRSPGHATSHHGGDLWDAGRREFGVVPEHPPEVLFVRENLVLHGQVHPGAVHQVDDWQAVLQGNFLGAEVLFSCDGKPRACFHSGVVGHGQTQFAVDASELHHHTA